MTDELSLSPVSDCNSNNVETSYTSNTSELEFIQDNSDYQWCVDYGYREVASHRSVLSSCYDELARDLDSQLAQVDMEDYSAQEILSTLPAICCPATTERQGEMFASVSGSLMVKFEFDSSLSPHTSSQDESSMSLCQSEPLFSPVKEAQLPNYSVDSLDEGEQLIVTCQANKTNYTIAFHGSTTLLGDTTSEYTDTGESMGSVENEKHHKAGGEGIGKMTASDAPRTTWSKLRRGGSETRRSRSKTVSLPDLGPQPGQLSASLATNLGGCVKLYDINSSSVTSESFSGSSSGGGGSGGGGKQTYFSLLRMFIAQRTLDQNIDHNRAAPADSASSDLLSACYEDSLVRESDGSSVERISSSKDASICTCSIQSATDSSRFNVNNNNSLERPIVGGKVNAGTATSGSDLSAATTSSDPPTGDTRLCPVHRVDRAIQTSTISLRSNQSEEKSIEDKGKKPVYVLYPNYTLPDLGFLRGGPSAERVLLAPVPFSPTGTQAPPSHHPSPPAPSPYRRVTRNDVEALQKKGVGHVMDWSSLAPLLPSEYWPVLSELPQVKQHLANRIEKPTFVQTTKESAPVRDIQTQDCRTTTGNSSGWSTGTAPSSGYRGSSTLLSESGGADPRQHNNPLYVYNYSEERRAAGPKHGVTLRQQESKRYSMFEFGGLEDILNETDVTKKRKSFPAQQPKSGHGEVMEPRETECWEDWWRDTAKRPHSPPSTHATRLDHLLELSGEAESWRPQEIRHLRDQVSRALCEVGRGKCVSFADRGGGSGDQQLTPPNSPTNNQKPYQCKQPTLAEMRQYPEEGCRSRYDFTNKKKLLERIGRGVEKVVSCAHSDEVSLAQTVLDSLCPPLYSLLTDGLRPRLETAFGPIGNSVWQVVEASAQQGPMTRALHELVLKLNSEDVLSEGLIKFNAFIFGLLNVHGMDAWMSYIRTRESILSKHYTEDSLLLSASRGHAKSRCLTDQLLASLKPLSRIDFHLDLLYETRLLHESLLQLAKLPLSPSSNVEMTTDSLLLKKIVQSIKSGLSGGTLSSGGTDQSSGTRDSSPHLSGGRPRSCVDPSGGGSADLAKKRWSGVQVGSRLVSAFDRLQSPEQDSLEVDAKSGSEEGTSEADEERKTAGKFRSLQRKWELLSGRTDHTNDSTLSGKPSGAPRSRIPRPVTSPVRPLTSRLPTPVSVQRRALSSAPTHRSRELEVEKVKWRPRPTTGRQNSGGSQKRTGLSTPSRGGQQQRTVVTLTHRLPTDSGHLAFNEGERLRLVLEVDDSWLLCCRGDAKGLVPRSAVI